MKLEDFWIDVSGHRDGRSSATLVISMPFLKMIGTRFEF